VVKIKVIVLVTLLVIAFSPFSFLLMPLFVIAAVLGGIYLIATKWKTNNSH